MLYTQRAIYKLHTNMDKIVNLYLREISLNPVRAGSNRLTITISHGDHSNTTITSSIITSSHTNMTVLSLSPVAL